MGKLDQIIIDVAGSDDADSYRRKEAKLEIKELFIEILDTTDVLGPEHPQTNLWYKDLKKKIEDL